MYIGARLSIGEKRFSLIKLYHRQNPDYSGKIHASFKLYRCLAAKDLSDGFYLPRCQHPKEQAVFISKITHHSAMICPIRNSIVFLARFGLGPC